MQKQDILDLIEKFERETWKYNRSNELNHDMEYIDKIYFQVKNGKIDLDECYKRLLSIFEIIRFKYGFESIIINSIPKLKEVKERLSIITLESENIIEESNSIRALYSNTIKTIDNVDFIKLPKTTGDEGLYLAIESLKSLITNKDYRSLLTDGQIEEILIDCIKLINKKIPIEFIEKKYENVIKTIWKNTLQNFRGDGTFCTLFTSIVPPTYSRALEVFNRPNQNSCSFISSDFIATYGGKSGRIGFIYPSDTHIIMASAYDLGTNVFGNGARNKEKGTLLVTPEALKRIGIERTKEEGQDPLSSNCYNEVAVDAKTKPCGILMIGFEEDDLCIYKNEIEKISHDLGIPIYKINLLDYKEELSEEDKYYIAFNCICAYLGITSENFEVFSDAEKIVYIENLVKKNKEFVSSIFLQLKRNGTLNKDNMFLALSNILNTSEIFSILDTIGSSKI